MEDKKLQDLKEYDGKGSWHPGQTFQYINFKGMITGCGLGQLHGITCYSKEDLEKKLVEITAYCKKTGCGMALATLGQSYYSHERKLLELGFKMLAEYNNLRHGNHYKQRLYGFEIK